MILFSSLWSISSGETTITLKEWHEFLINLANLLLVLAVNFLESFTPISDKYDILDSLKHTPHKIRGPITGPFGIQSEMDYILPASSIPQINFYYSLRILDEINEFFFIIHFFQTLYFYNMYIISFSSSWYSNIIIDDVKRLFMK